MADQIVDLGSFAGSAAPAVKPATAPSKEVSLKEFAGEEAPSEGLDADKILKGGGANIAGVADMVLSLPGMALGAGADIGSRLVGAAAGQPRRQVGKEGLEIGAKVAEATSNPIAKLMDVLGYGDDYKKSDVTRAMSTFSSWIEKGGQWIEDHTDGAIQKEDIQSLTNVLMVAGGAKGGDFVGGKLMPKGPAADLAQARESYANVNPETMAKAGPQKTAQQVINETMGIKSTKEREAWTAQRKKDVRAAFTSDKDLADYYSYLADERLGYGVGYPEARKIDREAPEMGAESGRADPRLLARTAVVGGGAVAGSYLDDKHPYAGALMGALAGAMLPAGESVRSRFRQTGAVKEKGGMWHPEAVERLADPLWRNLSGHTQVPLRETINSNAAGDLQIKAKAQGEWSQRAIRNYLNKHAGTASDPLKDVEVPHRLGQAPWGKVMDDAIATVSGEGVPGGRTGERVYDIRTEQRYAGQALQSYLSHVGDYLREFVPVEKLGQYDLVRAVRETAAQDAKQAAKMEKARVSGEGTTPYKTYPNGMKWVEVKSPEALKNEGDVMGHCVGGYCEAVHSGESKIYSLRDKKGMSHVTIEVGKPHGYMGTDLPKEVMKALEARATEIGGGTFTDEEFLQAFEEKYGKQANHIQQIKGKQNRAPVAEYLPYVQDFVKSGKWGEVRDLHNTGLIRAQKTGEFLTPEEATKQGKGWIGTEEPDIFGDFHEGGSIDPRLLARMAAVGVGATAGAYLDPDHPIEGALVGALGGAAASRIKPEAIVPAIKKAFAPDTRIRVNDLANEHEYSVKQAARGIWQLQNQLEELVPNPERRAAIAHWREGDRSIQLSPKEREAATLAGKFFEGFRASGLESGVLKDSIENYVTHIYGKQGKGLLDELMRGPSGPSMSPDTPFAMRRKGPPTLAEINKLAREKGIAPITEDLSVIAGIYGNSLSRAMANKRMLETLKSRTDPEGRKLIELGTKAPASYVSINHPQLAGLRVHPDIASSLRFIFDHSDPSVVVKGLEALNMAVKRSAVSFSLFHAKALTDALIGAASNPFKAVGKIPAMILGKDAMLKQLKKGGEGDVVDLAQKAGLQFSMERGSPAVEDVSGSFYTGMESLQKFLDETVPGAGLPVKGVIKLNQQVDKFMWGRLHAGMKLNIFSEKFQQLAENNAKAHLKDPSKPIRSKEEIAQAAASFTNDIFGGLNWRRVAEEAKTKWGRDIALALFSPTGRRINQLLLFAPDWTLSTVRSAAKAFRKGSGPEGILSPKTTADLHRQYLIRSAIYYAAVGDAINVAMSGHHLWQNKDPSTIDMGDGRVMQWSKHTMEPVHWLTKPGQQAVNKLGFIPREVANQALGTEYLSTSGHSPRMKNRVAHLLRQTLPIAVQQQNEAGTQSQGWSGFFGAPIYGKTNQQREEIKERKKLDRELRGGMEGARG